VMIGEGTVVEFFLFNHETHETHERVGNEDGFSFVCFVCFVVFPFLCLLKKFPVSRIRA
jgi:hypothetical protein